MNSTKVLAVIPARLGSKRFPRKALHMYRDKPLLFYLYKSIAKSKKIDRLVIGTDSPEIKKVMESYGAEVIKTSKKHQTGSDRVAEVSKKIKSDLVLNIQGDNFGLKATTLDSVISKVLRFRSINFATLAYRINSDNDLFNPNVVKLIKNQDNDALWFSRFPIPYLIQTKNKNRFKQFGYFGHLGVYIFRWKALQQFAGWKRGLFERAESLEQLRILENNEKIRIFTTKAKSISIDTKDDLKKIEFIL
jgi:3-deoxy-manno-octulosonate cytidylyltransferase (CMP-KDO synthetase)